MYRNFETCIKKNAPLGLLFPLMEKLTKKIKPDSIRLRPILRDRICCIIASIPTELLGPHFGS